MQKLHASWRNSWLKLLTAHKNVQKYIFSETIQLKTKVNSITISSPETSGSPRTTSRYNPEGRTSQSRRRNNFKIQHSNYKSVVSINLNVTGGILQRYQNCDCLPSNERMKDESEGIQKEEVIT
jgi:hypothetical protein